MEYGLILKGKNVKCLKTKLVKLVLYHHCMACPKIICGGDGLQIQRLVLIMLNIKSQIV
jgi:hypothetical protein